METAKAPPGIHPLESSPWLANPCAAAPDLSSVADAEEISDMAWRLERGPIVELFYPEELDERRELQGETKEQAAQRWAAVRQWMRERGGAEAALLERPVIAVFDDDRFVPLDGWHRCVVAWADYSLWNIPMLVGYPLHEPDIEPEF